MLKRIGSIFSVFCLTATIVAGGFSAAAAAGDLSFTMDSLDGFYFNETDTKNTSVNIEIAEDTYKNSANEDVSNNVLKVGNATGVATIKANTDTDLTGDYVAMEFDFKPTQANMTGSYLNIHMKDINRRAVSFNLIDNNFGFNGFGEGYTPQYPASRKIAVGKWAHFKFVFDTINEKINVFVDGVLVAKDAPYKNLRTGTTAREPFGQITFSNASNADYYLDNVELYSTTAEDFKNVTLIEDDFEGLMSSPGTYILDENQGSLDFNHSYMRFLTPPSTATASGTSTIHLSRELANDVAMEFDTKSDRLGGQGALSNGAWIQLGDTSVTGTPLTAMIDFRPDAAGENIIVRAKSAGGSDVDLGTITPGWNKLKFVFHDSATASERNFDFYVNGKRVKENVPYRAANAEKVGRIKFSGPLKGSGVFCLDNLKVWSTTDTLELADTSVADNGTMPLLDPAMTLEFSGALAADQNGAFALSPSGTVSAAISGTTAELSFDGLRANTAYTLTIDGLTGEDGKVLAKTVLRFKTEAAGDLAVGKPIVSTESGVANVSWEVRNVSGSEKNAVLILAVKKDGILKKVSVEQPQTIADGAKVTLTGNVAVTENGSTLEAYIWNGLDSIQPLTEKQVLNG